MKPLPTLRQLRYLVCVVDTRHFGRAAEICLVTQSTLSAGIQELETLIGVPLLERTKRSVVPTPLGLDIAERARAILRSAEDLVDVAAAAREPMAGPLRLGVIPTVGPFMLPRVLPALRQSYPQLKLFLREDQTARLLAQLRAGELDAAVIALPYATAELEVADIAEDRFVVVCPPGHELASRRVARAGDLAVEDLLLLEDGHCLRDHALTACALEGAQRNVAFQGTSLHTLVQMVADGLGLTLLPQVAIDAGILRGLDLPVLRLEDSAPPRRIGLVWRRSSGRRQTFEQLAAELARNWASAAAARPERSPDAPAPRRRPSRRTRPAANETG